MNHDEALLLLPDLLRAKLGAEQSRRLSEHLRGCPECEGARAALAVLMVKAGERPAVTGRDRDHPDSAEIVGYAIAPPYLAPGRAVAIEQHLSGCPTCREDVELAAQAHLATSTGRRASRGGFRVPVLRWPAGAWVALAAAGLLVAVLAYPAFLGFSRLPVAERDLENLRGIVSHLGAELQASAENLAKTQASLESLRGRGAAVAPALLHGIARGAAGAPTVRVSADQPFTAVAVDLLLPSEARGAAADVVFEVVTGDGEVRWSSEMDAAAAERSLRDVGAVMLLLPSSSLRAGSYQLRIMLRRPLGDEVLSLIPFAVVRGD